MKIAVIGAGAVGCFYGGMLARAGQDVVLIGRPRHVDAIRARGLRFESRLFDEQVTIAASANAASVEDADIVLVCVKSVDTEQVADEIRSHLKREALVVSLQNGIDNAGQLEQVLARPVIPAAVYVASEMAGDGHLRHHGRGDLVIGQEQGSELVARLFHDAGVPTVVSANVARALWEKLILNCAYNALSAIVNLPYGEIRGVASAEEAMRNLIAECLAVAHAEGVDIDLDADGQLERIRRTIPLGQYSSMAQDFTRGRASEIAALNGAIVRRGNARGVPTPVNQIIVALVELLESQHPQK
ncbi:ketopantoate reductase [Cupriavidus sp. OV038]|jgi:2-dehydropantoate 2-reductase|uniref:ketopantoate reductase family protein n=1 Tax=unclassified Cupriavidus TaxID=2640874 RepID=UPI0008E7EA68|nr:MULTISPECIES: ketopantoate reductase family protein [unclassified Cupriavidus]SFC96637.1 ketopantoate reductase [Cupriavidus sp. OV038]SFP64774.1 ketopantoate reductase [Cupriavidus sp. OV096]